MFNNDGNISGDVIFFLGRVITHNAVEITGGVRNVVDCFAHGTVLSWKDKMHYKATGIGRNHEIQKYQKDQLLEEVQELQLEEAKWEAAKSDPNSGFYKEPFDNEGSDEDDDNVEMLWFSISGKFDVLFHRLLSLLNG